MNLDSALVHIVVAVGAYVSIYNAFDKLDSRASPEFRSKIVSLHAKAKEFSDPYWGLKFLIAIDELLDRWLGTKYLSAQSLIWSSGFSFGYVFLGFFVCYVKHSREWGEFLDGPWFFTLAGTVVAANITPDYLSLAVTRVILKRMIKNPSWLSVVGWFALDLVLDLIIIYSSMLVVAYAAYVTGFHPYKFRSEPHFFAYFWRDMEMNFTFSSPTSAFVYASLFTSLSVWLFMGLFIALAFFKAAARIPATVIDAKKYPITALGAAFAAIAFVGTLTFLSI